MKQLIFLCAIFLLCNCHSSYNTLSAPNEKLEAEHWAKKITKLSPALSFVYGVEQSAEILARSHQKMTRSTDSAGITTIRNIYDDQKTGIRYTIEATYPKDLPAVEWYATIENRSKDTSALFTRILAADIPVSINNNNSTNHYGIRYSQGTRDSYDDFSLHDTIVSIGKDIQFVTASGRSSSRYLPFFNIHRGQEGIIFAIGWTGQWKARFAASEKEIRLQAGMENSHLRLYPNEKIRTPRILMTFWKGDQVRAQNQLRRYLVKYASPHPSGKEVEIPVSFPAWGGMTTAHHLRNIAIIKEKQLDNYTNYWIDAGWFGGPHNTLEWQNPKDEDWYGLVGNWDCNTIQHPNGLRPISDAAHAAGLKFLLWYEPERAVGGTPVTRQHPEWFIKLPDSFPRNDVGKYKKVESLLLNLGIPEARQWITDYISRQISESNMDILRIDANIGTLRYWKCADKPDRIGMTEIRYVEGLYQFLDDLLSKHPNLLIDNCAGGGNRLDIEMLRRSVALHRTDYACPADQENIGNQIQNYCIMNWIPYSNMGSAILPNDTYRFRGGMNAGMNNSFLQKADDGSRTRMPDNFPWDWYREMMQQHAAIKTYFSGDYYPLTPFSKGNDSWCAYQLYRSDLKAGFILAFRRSQANKESLIVFPGGINSKSKYEMEDFDLKTRTLVSGKELLKKGWIITLKNRSSSALIKIRELKP